MSAQHLTAQIYTRQIMTPLAREIAQWSQLGGSVYTGATSETLATALADGPTLALILVSHWQDLPIPAIELFDGMRRIEEIANAFPSDYVGAIDLCICQATGLAKALMSRAPDCIVRWENVETTPAIWFPVYTLAFTLMRDRGITYMSAMDEAIRGFLYVSKAELEPSAIGISRRFWRRGGCPG